MSGHHHPEESKQVRLAAMTKDLQVPHSRDRLAFESGVDGLLSAEEVQRVELSRSNRPFYHLFYWNLLAFEGVGSQNDHHFYEEGL